MNEDVRYKLFRSLKGAFKVKKRLIKDSYNDITDTDIWNYLKINKWSKDKDLTLSEMVNDIIDVNIESVNSFIKKYNLKKEGN